MRIGDKMILPIQNISRHSVFQLREIYYLREEPNLMFMKNLKKINRQEMKTITGGITCPGGQLCFIGGKWQCRPYDGCGGGNQP